MTLLCGCRAFTLQRNPELAAFTKEMRALEGATLQAGLLPNPELLVNVENIGNTRPLTNDVNSAEVRRKRSCTTTHHHSDQSTDRAWRKTCCARRARPWMRNWLLKTYETRRVELIARVANVFPEVLAGQERLRLAEESQQLAQRVVNAVAKRVQAGKVPPIEETRAGVAFSTTRNRAGTGTTRSGCGTQAADSAMGQR